MELVLTKCLGSARIYLVLSALIYVILMVTFEVGTVKLSSIQNKRTGTQRLGNLPKEAHRQSGKLRRQPQ